MGAHGLGGRVAVAVPDRIDDRSVVVADVPPERVVGPVAEEPRAEDLEDRPGDDVEEPVPRRGHEHLVELAVLVELSLVVVDAQLELAEQFRGGPSRGDPRRRDLEDLPDLEELVDRHGLAGGEEPEVCLEQVGDVTGLRRLDERAAVDAALGLEEVLGGDDPQGLPDGQVDLLIRTGGERGLLGLAFDPDYANNGNLYVYASAPGGL